jgi:hypothetical protein
MVAQLGALRPSLRRRGSSFEHGTFSAAIATPLAIVAQVMLSACWPCILPERDAEGWAGLGRAW